MCCVCWGGLRLLRVAWEDFVCGFWTGLVLAWCWLGDALGWLGAGFGVAVACVVIPCLRSYACWAGLGSVGGIATIGAALRRVAGVSVVYGRKTPRVLAQSAVHLGDMRVTWGFWGVVDDGLGALVRGEAFSARRRVGYVGPQCVLPG